MCGLLPKDFYELEITELWKMSNAKMKFEAAKVGKYRPKLQRNNRKTLEWLKEYKNGE